MLISFIAPFSVAAQLVDDFSDGDFTANPTWSGDAANFEVDGNFELHLDAPVTADESYLSTASIAIDTAQWDATIEMDFNPSSGNRSRIYLTSSSANLEGSLNGYFVQLGNSEDEVSLYRQTGTSATKIIDGVDDLLDVNSVSVMIRVTRSTVGEWQLFADTSVSGNFLLMGDTVDTTHITSSYFGVFCDYTSTRSDKFYFDDITVTGNAYLDNQAPKIQSVSALSSDSLLIVYNESVDAITASDPNNYNINLGIGTPTSAVVNGDSAVWLELSNTLTSGSDYELTVNDVEDLSGNAISNASSSFTYFDFANALYRDIVINEIFADPTPSQGLPEEEFVEIYNNTNKAFDLTKAHFADSKDTVDFPEGTILAPKEYAILCNDNDTALFTPFGRVIGLSTLPTLNNSDDDLKLIIDSILIDRVLYTDQWYVTEDRKGNGYTLEQINPASPCGGSGNWRASESNNGGTPGSINSIYDDSPDTQQPEVTSSTIVDHQTIQLGFSESMDSASLANAGFSLSNNGPVISSRLIESGFSIITLFLSQPLDSAVLYDLTYSSDITDCAGNNIVQDTLQIGLGNTPQAFDIIINEIFSDPEEGGSLPFAEFVEIYNRTDKLLNVGSLRISDRSSGSTVFSGFLQPKEYAIICDDGYVSLFEPFGKVLAVSSMPSLNNSDDDIAISVGTKTIDELSYSDGWYNDEEKAKGGFTLERIDPENLCGLSSNWAASNAPEGGTPGSANSIENISSSSAGPQLISAQLNSINSAIIEFDQRLDTLSIITSTFSTNEEVLAKSDSLLTSLIQVESSKPFVRGENVKFHVDSLRNCAGIQSVNLTYELYLPDTDDVIINEVLFNPHESGSDFVELHNTSAFDISLQGWSLAYYDNKDSLRFNEISSSALILPAGDYVALNEDIENIEREYPNSIGEVLVETNLPSYSNDEGSVIIYDQLSEQIEWFNYTEDMHFALIDDANGVSLERISPNRPVNEIDNWHSASSSENYATPGYLNSQDYNSSSDQGFELSAEHISPDNDGYQDVVNVDYTLPDAGHVANVDVYNDRGILIRTLYTNQLLANSGSLTWDGTNDNGEKARSGIHIILVETFDLSGNRSRYRLPVVVATKL